MTSRERNADRDRAIWRSYLNGHTQQEIADQHGLTQPAISLILSKIRKSLPELDRADLVRREVDLLDRLRAESLELWDMRPIPAYSNGKPILMEDGVTVAEDHSGRLAALDRAVRLHERLAKLVGLEAPSKVEATVTNVEREAAKEAAAVALAYLAGDSDVPSAGGPEVDVEP